VFKGKYDGETNIMEIFDWIANQNQQKAYSLDKPNF
jgi:hypothetical protein